ncbi:unnamed protein product [Vitrella brassicaformis CCMP3155]|uniref:Protein kinase domain-containing protein n=1 Tax=Vitrella brassicaformis (strain CCMP3155) TaxID=1169540 RepID=A0A0G4FES2_VITBC|nr:unnamed protein product [Vitrella brassicaformis CCMP3155]|eukprot:CEM11700.1 unnamed protein product [Vitrella brassicaformis CCMP3155]
MHRTLGLFHRDIKLENVMLSTRWEKRRTLRGTLVWCPTVVEQGPRYWGTPGIPPPEVRFSFDRSRQWAQVDGHGVGCVLYDLLRCAAPVMSPSNDFISRNRYDLPRILGLANGVDVQNCPDMTTARIQRSIDNELERLRNAGSILGASQKAQLEVFIDVTASLLQADPMLCATPSQVCSVAYTRQHADR